MFAPFKSVLEDRLMRLAFLCLMVMGIGIASINPFQSLVGVERLGLSDTAYAFMVACGALFSAAASIIVGIISDQTGKRRQILLLSLAIGMSGSAYVFLFPSVVSFIILHAVLYPIGATAFTQFFALARLAAIQNKAIDEDAGMALIRAGFSATFGITPPLWGVALSGGVDILSVYAVASLATGLVLALAFFQWPRDGAIEEEKSGLGFFASLKEVAAPNVMIRTAFVSMLIGANGLYNILLGLLFVNDLGGTEADVGRFAGVVALIEIPVMLYAGILLRRFTKAGLIFFGGLIYAVFFLALPLMPSIGWAWATVVPAGIGAGIILSVTIGYVQDLVADRPGAGSSLIAVSHFTAMAFGSMVFALGSAITDYRGTALIGAAISLSAGLAVLALDRWKITRQPANDGHSKTAP